MRPIGLLALCCALACSSEQGAPVSSAGTAGTPSASGGAGSSSGGNAGNSSLGGQASAGHAGTMTTTGGAAHSSGGAAGASAGASTSAGSGTGGSSAGQAGSANGGQATGGSPTGGAGGSTGVGGGGTTPIKIYLAGDSTVQQCSGTCPCGWGSQFDPLFNDQVTVVNRAVGGRSIQTWLYEGAVSSTLGGDGECTLSSETYDKRWRDMLDATTGMKPGDYLFIQFGINDGDRTCPRHVGIDAFKAYLADMAKAAKDRGAQAIFVTPVSAIACSGSKATATRGAFVDATKAAATAAGVPVIDLHQASITLYDSLGFCPNDDDYTQGELGAFFCADHTHFEAAGATEIAKLVAKALSAQAPGLAAYLR